MLEVMKHSDARPGLRADIVRQARVLFEQAVEHIMNRRATPIQGGQNVATGKLGPDSRKAVEAAAKDFLLHDRDTNTKLREFGEVIASFEQRTDIKLREFGELMLDLKQSQSQALRIALTAHYRAEYAQNQVNTMVEMSETVANKLYEFGYGETRPPEPESPPEPREQEEHTEPRGRGRLPMPRGQENPPESRGRGRPPMPRGQEEPPKLRGRGRPHIPREPGNPS